MAGAEKIASVMRQLGCDRQVISKQRVLELEPAMQPSAAQIVGETYC